MSTDRSAALRQPEAKPPIVVFVHIPKCGGVSVEHFLDQTFGRANVLHAKSVPKENWQEKVVPALRAFIGHVPYGAQPHFRGRPVYYYSLLRNPLDRFVSFYNYVRSTPTHNLHKFAAEVDIGTFFENALKNRSLFGPQTTNIQCTYITGKTGASFEQARRLVREKYCRVLPLHRINDLFEDIYIRCGIPGKPSSPSPKNCSPKFVTSDAIPKQLRECMYERMVEDTNLYNYITRIS